MIWDLTRPGQGSQTKIDSWAAWNPKKSCIEKVKKFNFLLNILNINIEKDKKLLLWYNVIVFLLSPEIFGLHLDRVFEIPAQDLIQKVMEDLLRFYPKILNGEWSIAYNQEAREGPDVRVQI